MPEERKEKIFATISVRPVELLCSGKVGESIVERSRQVE
jgi:hypothetical protein